MTGIERIAAERKRQVEKEGYSAEHDDEHGNGELLDAALCYGSYVANLRFVIDPWPWGRSSDKRRRSQSGRTVEVETTAEKIRLLEKSGALIAAEIDRLLRLENDQ